MTSHLFHATLPKIGNSSKERIGKQCWLFKFCCCCDWGSRKLQKSTQNMKVCWSPLPDCEDWCCSAHYSTIHRVRGRGIDSCKFSTFCFLFNIENQTCPDPWEWRKLGLLWPKFKNVMLSIWRCYIHLRCYHQRGWSLLLFWTFGLRSL